MKVKAKKRKIVTLCEKATVDYTTMTLNPMLAGSMCRAILERNIGKKILNYAKIKKVKDLDTQKLELSAKIMIVDLGGEKKC